MDFLTAVLAFIIFLIPAIIVHEFGHLLACKMVGISVVEFGLGFPPRVARLFRWGETEFTLNLLPIGGFVMPYGEDFIKPQTEAEMAEKREELLQRRRLRDGSYRFETPESAETAKDEKREPTREEKLAALEARAAAEGIQLKSVFDAKPWQKIWFLSAGALANFAMGFVLFVAVGLLGAPTRFSDVYLNEVFPETEAGLKALRADDQITHINGAEVQDGLSLETNLAEIVERNPETPINFTIYRGLTNQTFDVELTPDLEAIENSQEFVRILEVQSNTPAQEAGFLAQDLILAVDGELIETLEEMQEITAANEGREISVLVDRRGEEVELMVTPVLIEGDNEGRARIGITINILQTGPALGFLIREENISNRYVPLSIGESLSFGAERVRDVLGLFASFPSLVMEVVRGEQDANMVRPVSAVGVSQLGADVIQERPFQDVLLFMALISIGLGVTNLLPIPALDGGRILFVLIEIVRGKPMSPEREGMVHLVGFAILILLSVVLIINDLANPLGFSQ